MATLSVLIVSFNTREMTCACLASLLERCDLASVELIVIDNASADGSADAIAARFPSVRLVRCQENLGFAAGNNLAARDASGEYLLLLNPDTVVLDGAIDRLLSFAKAYPDAGIWGGQTVFGDGSLNHASCWRRISVWNQFCRALGLSRIFKGSPLFASESYGGWKRDSVRRVDIVSGCFLLIRRALWERLGGFNESFFMYGEDADLCLRARRCGAQPMITPDATIVHHGGASEPVRADKQVRLHAAKAMLIRRHWPKWQAPLGIGLMKLGIFLRARAGILGRMTNSNDLLESATVWEEVWMRRREWCAAPQWTASRSAVHGDLRPRRQTALADATLLTDSSRS